MDLMISLRPQASDWENAWKKNNESHPLVSDWAFQGVGIGVQDLDATIKYYSDIGFEETSEELVDRSFGTRGRSVCVGPLWFSFFETSGKESVYSESIETREDGVNDLVFSVASLDSEINKLESKGVELYRRSDDGKSAFFDTRAEGNIMIRLVQ